MLRKREGRSFASSGRRDTSSSLPNDKPAEIAISDFGLKLWCDQGVTDARIGEAESAARKVSDSSLTRYDEDNS